MYLLFLFLCGCGGAIIKDILKDGYLIIPYRKDKRIYLGCIASAIVGGAVGLAVDHSYLTAFLSGFVGFSIVENMIINKLSPLNLNPLNKTNG